MRIIRLFGFLITVLLVSSCGQSYSPFLVLPKEPLHEREFQIAGGIGGMPAVSESFPSVSSGELVLMRYGVSDNFSLQFEEWADHFPSVSSNGISIEGVSLLSERTSPWRFAIVPRVAVMNNGNDIRGWGGSATLAAWTPTILGLHPYLGAGLLIGSGRVDYQTKPINDSEDAIITNHRQAIGFGGTFNAGLAYDLFDHLTLNAEFATSGILIHDTPDYFWNGFWVWGLAVGYRF